jgi:hypothetical protein
MADVGSVVGIVSLILQVSKGVVFFVDNAKDAKNKVLQISDQMESLTDQLEALESLLDKYPCGRPKDATQAGIIACSNALDKIKQQLAPFSKTKTSGIRHLLQDVRVRLAYPFKHESIMFCKDIVQSVQYNLTTALQVLEM